MISTINFENHINRFLETMRGVQRILFVGTGICIENYPVLAGEKWKCIYTTNQSDRLADTFSRAERQVRPIYTKHEYDSARTKLDQNNPLLVFINGRASKENDDEDIDQEVERRENSKLLLKSMTSLLKSDLMVELVIVGYNPQDNGELSPYDLYAELRLLSDNRVTFYGVTPEIAANKYIKKLANDGIVTLFAQDLGEALENRCSVADNDSEDSPVVTHDVENANNTVYIDGHPVVLDASLCYDFNKYGRVLSVREMATGTISRMMQTEFFYQFLKRSPHTPQWYGYAKRNSFAVPREFEDELYEKVHDGLEKNSETPVVLVGQTSSGKSVALAALAFRLFQERKYPVLFVNNPDVTFAKHSAAALALDNILKEIRDNGGRAIVILDWSVYNLQRSDTIGRIAYQFNNRGQNVLFVASAMTAVAETIRYVTVSAPIDLTASEKNRFKDLLVEKGKLPCNKVEQWMCRHENENGLLSMLYRLVYELHPQLELGLKKEITKALADTVEGIMELEDPIPEQKPLSSIAAQLLKLGLIDLPDTYTQEQVHSIKTSIIDSLQAFCEGLAVASLFKLRMPITMAMHLLQIPECSNRQQYRDVVFNAPWLHYALDDDKYSPGEYYVSFRDPMDARIYLHSINKSEADICAAFPSQGKQVNEPHNSGPGFIDSNFAILAALIPQKQSGEMIDSLGVSMADGPGNIFGNGSALLFGKRTHQGDEKLTGVVHGVDILFLEIDRRPGNFQTSDGSESIHGVSGEPGQRLGEDQIDFSVQSIGYHAVEAVPPADGQSGNTIIGVHPGKDPVRMALDVFREILLLGLEAVLLGIFHGGYSGIGCNPLCGRWLFRGQCPDWELNPCNSFLRQCCSPSVRQLVHGIFPQRHGVKCAYHLLQ